MSTHGLDEDEGSNIPEEFEDLLEKYLEEDLESLAPSTALEKYLEDTKAEHSPATVQSHRTRLQYFVHWCEEVADLQNLNGLTGRDLQNFCRWRRDDGDLCTLSERTQRYTLRSFLQWCESTRAVSTDLHEKVQIPTLDRGEDSRNTLVEPEKVVRILDKLSKYHYASLEHCVWATTADTGLRTGSLRALDVPDFHTDRFPSLELSHEKKTPLKNGETAERHIHLSEDVGRILEDYLNDVRPDVTDECGREPLFATEHGRISSSTIRNYVYKWTRPCQTEQTCPHDRDIDECAAAARNNQACKCPSSKSPHPVRRGYITHELDAGVALPVLCERVNATEDVLREHYDARTPREKMNHRKEQIESVHRGGNRYGK